MRSLLVSYDLIAPGRNYDSLHKFLKSQYAWAKPLESFYILKTDRSAEQFRNDVLPYVDRNDKVFVIDVTGDTAAWQNMPNEMAVWITKNL
jgi:hypothetical protein